MRSRHVFVILVMLLGSALALAAEGKPPTPGKARKLAGKKVTVEMVVKAAKDRLEKRGEVYLDSEADFEDEENFAVVITRDGAASLKKAGITNPAEHFKDKKIRATGTVKKIEIDDARQIRPVETK